MQVWWMHAGRGRRASSEIDGSLPAATAGTRSGGLHRLPLINFCMQVPYMSPGAMHACHAIACLHLSTWSWRGVYNAWNHGRYDRLGLYTIGWRARSGNATAMPHRLNRTGTNSGRRRRRSRSSFWGPLPTTSGMPRIRFSFDYFC
jgi:hypothetical protein